MRCKQFFKIGLGLSIALFMGMGNVAVADSGVKEGREISGWINTRIPFNISVKELAQRYYKDAGDYMIIVNANKDLLKKGKIYKKGKDYIVQKNTEIKVPITPKFEDQPEILGWN